MATRTVTTQSWRRRKRDGSYAEPRWGYVIHGLDFRDPSYASPYRWKSEAAALKAGEADAEQCDQFDAENR